MEKVTEFELMQALWNCSWYVKDLPTKEEASAINNAVCQLLTRWIVQQNLPEEEGFELLDRVVEKGPVGKAAEEAYYRRHPYLAKGASIGR